MVRMSSREARVRGRGRGKQEGRGKQVLSGTGTRAGGARVCPTAGRPGRGRRAFRGDADGRRAQRPRVLDLEEVGGPRVDGRWVDGKLTEQW